MAHRVAAGRGAQGRNFRVSIETRAPASCRHACCVCLDIVPKGRIRWYAPRFACQARATPMGRHRASVARCSSESDLLHSAWRAGRVQKIRVGNMRWLGHFTAHFSDEVECPDAFVARLEVLLRMVVPVMLGVLRLRLEHHALAPQMWMIDHE